MRKIERQQHFSSAVEPSRQVLEIYENKFAHARDHSHHMNYVLTPESICTNMTELAARQPKMR